MSQAHHFMKTSHYDVTLHITLMGFKLSSLKPVFDMHIVHIVHFGFVISSNENKFLSHIMHIESSRHM